MNATREGRGTRGRGLLMLVLMLAGVACQGRSEPAAVVRSGATPAAPAVRTAQLTPAQLNASIARLAELRVAGFTGETRYLGEGVIELALLERTPSTAAPLQLRLTVARCLACPAIADVPAWQQRRDGLRLLVPSALREAPDTIFELAPARLDGDAYVTTYQLGFARTGKGQLQSHAVTAYWNDGVVQARVIAHDDASPASDRAALASRRGRPALRAAAERVLAEVLAALR